MKPNTSASCDLPANTATAYALLTDKTAIQESYEGREGVEVSISNGDSGSTVLVTRPITAGPIQTVLRLEQKWRPDDSDEGYLADIDYRLLATPIAISGTMQLQPTTSGSRLTAALNSRVAIPILSLILSPLLAKLVTGKLQADLEYQRDALAGNAAAN